MDSFLLGVGSSLVAAIIAAVAGYLFRGHVYKRKLDAAPEKYVEHLDRLIQTGLNEGVKKAIVNSRVIVAARDDLRDSLLSLTSLLNSEIDTLQRQLDILPRFSFELVNVRSNEGNPLLPPNLPDESYDSVKLYETIEVLAKKWPSKRDQIKYSIRKMIAELGLDTA